MDYSYSYKTSGSLPPGVLATILIVSFILYVFFGFCLMKMAQKSKTDNGWFAFIPVLNVVLMLQIVRRPVWWILLLLIPFVNFVILVITYMDLAVTFGMSKWIGCVSVFISPLLFILFPYWAFSGVEAKPIERAAS
ncbi:MAG: DUF5684 domain-containing protein [bacterium]